MSAILSLKDIKLLKGGTLIIDVPSLCVAEGEIVYFLGPNGAGKTTLLQVMSMLIPPSDGAVIFRGEKVTGRKDIVSYRRKLAVVFQEPLLLNSSVFENVAAGLKIRGVKRSEIRATVMDCLNRFGIDHLHDRSARTISGGEAQRTSLARAFAVKPEILFLDEPFSALDPPTRESLVDDLEKILRESKTTALVAAHDRMEALRLSDRIAVMSKGVIVQIGTPAEVINRPVDSFVASFLGTETLLTGSVLRANGAGVFIVSVSGYEIEVVCDVRPEEKVILCIRPENVFISTNAARDSMSARNVFPGTIERITLLGAFYKVELDCGFPLVAYVTNHAREELCLEEGKIVTASFKATAIHTIKKHGHDVLK